MAQRGGLIKRVAPSSRWAFATTLLLAGCPSDDPDSGSGWQIVATPDESVGALLSVWGATSDELRAVGGQIDAVGNPGVGVILARQGDGQADSWVDESIPEGTPLLNWIHGAGGVTWAVGNAGAAIRHDGSAWTRDDTPVDVPLWGVWVLSAGEAWAVGGDAFDPASEGVLVHYVGGVWSEVAMPLLDRPSRAAFKVWASSPNDVHVVGSLGVILHYDGATWTQVPTEITADLISVWGTTVTSLIAVGGRSGGVMARSDGTTWTGTSLARFAALNGVWIDDDGAALMAGERGTVLMLDAGSNEPAPMETPPSLLVMHGVFGLPSGERIVVGGSLNSQPPYQGVIMEYR